MQLDKKPHSMIAMARFEDIRHVLHRLLRVRTARYVVVVTVTVIVVIVVVVIVVVIVVVDGWSCYCNGG
jgi:hypothetical protein